LNCILAARNRGVLFYNVTAMLVYMLLLYDITPETISLMINPNPTIFFLIELLILSLCAVQSTEGCRTLALATYQTVL